MKLFLFFAMFASSAAFANTLEDLQKIVKNVEVGNGSVSITPYNVQQFDQKATIAKDYQDVANMMKGSGVKCGPYGVTSDRRETIKMLADYTGDQKTAAALADLYKKDKIFKMHSIHMNHNIDCSRIWIEVFTVDGLHLELYYGMND